MSAAGECNLYSATEGQTTFNLKRGKCFYLLHKYIIMHTEAQ